MAIEQEKNLFNLIKTPFKSSSLIWIKFFIFLFSTRPSPGLLPVLGPLKCFRRLHLTQPCFAALGLVLIWVERQVVRYFYLWMINTPYFNGIQSTECTNATIYWMRKLTPIHSKPPWLDSSFINLNQIFSVLVRKLWK